MVSLATCRLPNSISRISLCPYSFNNSSFEMVFFSTEITKKFVFNLNWLQLILEVNLFFSILFLAHFQAVLIPLFLGISSIGKFKKIKHNSFIPFGFIFLGLASMFEMIDHTQTDWIYVDHSSFYNWLFYSFLSLGLTSLSISVIKKNFTLGVNIFLSFCSIYSYLLLKDILKVIH